MYRILIADDEGIMLESLKAIISRNYPESCEVETAKTGRSAIEIAEYFHPDIVFMDIEMPGINGIEAMREIRNFNTTTLFYVISAYDKFDYAKQAISLGVERYITKPVTRSTILEVMREACAKVDEMRTIRSDRIKVQEKLETVIPVVENGFVGTVMMPGNFQDVSYYTQLLDIAEKHGYVCVFWLRQNLDDSAENGQVGIGVQMQELYPQFRAVVKSYLRCMVGQPVSDRIVVIVPFPNAAMEYEDRIFAINRMRELAGRLEKQLSLKVRVGIGRVRGLEDLRYSYQEAILALQESSSRIVHTDDISTHGFYEGEFAWESEHRIFQLLNRGDAEGLRSELNLFFDWMIKTYPDSLDNIRLKMLEYIMRAEKDAFHDGAVNYSFESRKNYLTEVMALTEFEGLRDWFLEKMIRVCMQIRDKRGAQSESVVSKAKAYILENFCKDISLDDVSREVNVSPYYFSKLFKEEAGENFIEYLTRLRIMKAKELLPDPQVSIKEISIQIGYGDPNYFSRIFKKQTGMTPREYRESAGSV